MTISYTPQDAFTSGPFDLPSQNGKDSITFENFIETVIQPLLDRTEFLFNRVAGGGTVARNHAKALADSNHALSGHPITLGSATVNDGEVVLLTAQTHAPDNGPWVVGATWERPTDWSFSAVPGSLFYIEAGTYGGQTWQLTTPDPIDLETTALTFAALAGGGIIPVEGPTASRVPIRTSTSGLKAAYLDSGAVSDLGFMRNGVTGMVLTSSGLIVDGTIESTGDANFDGDVTLSSGSLSADGDISSSSDVTGGRLLSSAIGTGNGVDVAFIRAGATIVSLVAAGFLFPSGLSSPSLGQAAPTTNATPQSFTLSPQAPATGTTATGSNRNPGHCIVDLADPTNGQVMSAGGPLFKVRQGGNPYVQMGRRKNDGLSNYGTIWVGEIASPDDTNYCFGSDGSTSSVFNIPSGGTWYVTIAGILGGFELTAAAMNFRPPILAFDVATSAPLIGQGAQTANSTNGQNLTVQAQNATGTTSNGGALKLSSGTGTSAAGSVRIQTGSVDQVTIAPSLMTLNAGQQQWLTHSQNSALTTTLDFSTGNIQLVNMGTNITSLLFTNLKVGGLYLLAFAQDASGNRLLTKPSTLKAPGGAITLSTGANKSDLFWSYSDGTNLYVIPALNLS